MCNLFAIGNTLAMRWEIHIWHYTGSFSVHTSSLKANQKPVHKLYTVWFPKAESQEGSKLKLPAEFRAQINFFFLLHRISVTHHLNYLYQYTSPIYSRLKDLPIWQYPDCPLLLKSRVVFYLNYHLILILQDRCRFTFFFQIKCFQRKISFNNYLKRKWEVLKLRQCTPSFQSFSSSGSQSF